MRASSPSMFKVFFVLCAVNHGVVTHAQTLYTRDAKVTVAPNTTISIAGSVENEGTIVNNGHLKVGGRWVNSGMYEPGEGQITFNSRSATVPQIIHHNGQTFNRVTIAGGTKKIILSDIIVTQEIVFENGIVEAAGNSRLIFDAGVQIVNASDSSHVHGVVFHKGNGYKLYPIGNGLTYLPVELTDVSDPSAFIGVQAFEFENVELAKPPTLESISNKRYWYIDVASGALPGSPIVLPFRRESSVLDSENIVVVQSASPYDEFTSIGRSSDAGDRNDGRIKSGINISEPFVTLATAAREAELTVYNAVSNNGDGLNEFVKIKNIEQYPSNRFTVFNRWGDKMFEIENYDNAQQVFRGKSNVNGESALVSGTYFYVLEIAGQESQRGFITVKN